MVQEKNNVHLGKEYKNRPPNKGHDLQQRSTISKGEYDLQQRKAQTPTKELKYKYKNVTIVRALTGYSFTTSRHGDDGQVGYPWAEW